MSKFVLLLIAVIFAFLFPVALFLIWRKNTKCKWIAFIIGVISFTVFANGLESIAHYYFLSINETTSMFLYKNIIAYTAYGALMAGLFEETGRLVSFKLLLNKYKTKEISVGYGIGHAGIECILTLGITYLLYVIVLGGGSLGDAATDLSVMAIIDQIDTALIPFAILERLIAICVHIGLSILVFKAANHKGSFHLYFVAILLHALTDVPAGLYQMGLIQSVIVIEVLTLAIGIAILFFGIKTYKKLEIGEKDEQSN